MTRTARLQGLLGRRVRPLARTRALLAAVVGLAAAALAQPAPLAAQEADGVRGRVVDAAGAPLPDLEVVLHRVTDAGGASMAWDTTTATGTFLLPSPDPAAAGAFYFVAVRFEGNLYIAEPFSAAEQPDSQITLQVGVPGTAAMSAASAGNTLPATSGSAAVRPPVSWRRWGIAVVVGLSLAGFLGYLVLRRRGAPARRRLLVEVAALEEELDAATGAGDQVAELRRAHAEALARLRAAPPR